MNMVIAWEEDAFTGRLTYVGQSPYIETVQRWTNLGYRLTNAKGERINGFLFQSKPRKNSSRSRKLY